MILALVAAVVLHADPVKAQSFDFDEDTVEVSKAEVAEAAKAKSQATSDEPVISARNRTKDEIRKAMRDALPAFKECYARALTDNPKLAGKVELKLSIDPTGRVKSLKLGQGDLKDPAVTSCIEKRAKAIVFAGADVTVTVTYPFVFKAVE